MSVQSILRHPALRPVKRATKNLWWTYKGLSISNPPLPPVVRTVLFVCLGNICRSPFAEVIAARRAKSAVERIVFASAGIATRPGSAPPTGALRVATSFGVSLDAHQPAQLTQELAEAHDLLVVMESQQVDALRAQFPHLSDRVILLSLFDQSAAAGLDRYNIADPFGLDDEAFEECYTRIDRAVVSLLGAIEARAAQAASRAKR